MPERTEEKPAKRAVLGGAAYYLATALLAGSGGAATIKIAWPDTPSDRNTKSQFERVDQRLTDLEKATEDIDEAVRDQSRGADERFDKLERQLERVICHVTDHEASGCFKPRR